MKLDKQSLNIEMITKNTELLGQKEQENNKRGERVREREKGEKKRKHLQPIQNSILRLQ